MRLRTWPILILAFATFAALIAFTGWGTLHRARRIYSEVSKIHDNYQRSEQILNQIHSEIHVSGLLVRDYLLDRSNLTSESYRAQLLALRSSIPKELQALAEVLTAQEAAALNRLREELDGYLNSIDPLFTWTPGQKLALSSSFLRREVLPRREAALAIAREIRDLNQARLSQQQRDVERKEGELPYYVARMLAITLLLGLVVAGLTIYRIDSLESRAEAQRARTEQAEQELRQLSQQLVKAQEEERRSISRELHDAIGQMLTAQRMELRNLKKLRTAPEEEFLRRLEETAQLSEQALRAVRDLAMGLRPSMLDDIGLGPAIEWQAREFSRRYGVPVTVQLEGPLDNLPETHRTCTYRAVQEALTNCARHAGASEIRVTIHGREDRLNIIIQDNGSGFDTSKVRGSGLGLLGIQERMRDLGGRAAILSQPGKGTVLSLEIPLETKEAGTK
jgi:signal transduction histidine kinase